MTFLSKLGSILARGLQIVTGLAPVVQALYPGAANAVSVVSKDLAEIGQIVVQVEAVGQVLSIAGPQKLTAAAPLVAQVVLQSSLLVGRKIHDEPLFLKGCSEIAGGMADVLNSLHDNVDTESKS